MPWIDIPERAARKDGGGSLDDLMRTDIVVANPDVQWGPRSIDILMEAAARWPRAGALGPLIRDPDGSVYPSARHLPSLIRGGMRLPAGLSILAVLRRS